VAIVRKITYGDEKTILAAPGVVEHDRVDELGSTLFMRDDRDRKGG